MQTYTVRLSDEDVERLRIAAEARHQAPDEVLQATVEEAIREGMLTTTLGPSRTLPPPPAPTDFTDPWAGFRGAFTADTPDIFERHDYYLGDAALDTHESVSVEPHLAPGSTVELGDEESRTADGNR